MLRSILAIGAGLLTAFVLIFLMEELSNELSPLPQELDMEDTIALTNAMHNAPITLYLLVLAGYVTGSFFGGLVAALISKEDHLRNALLVGAVLMASGLANLLMLPHANWFWASLLVYIPLAWLGAKAALAFKNRKNEYMY